MFKNFSLRGRSSIPETNSDHVRKRLFLKERKKERKKLFIRTLQTLGKYNVRKNLNISTELMVVL